MNTRPRTAVRVLALARVISLTGGAAAYTALNFEIYERTQSATWVAAALFLTFGTVGFASLFAGILGDRFDRQRVMVWSDLAGAAAFGAMALAEDPALLLAFAFASAVAEAPFMAASTAAVPNLVPEEDVSWANGTLALGRNAGILVGPLVGGAMVASVGAGAVFFLNAVSFVVSAVLVMTVRGTFAGDRDGDSGHRGVGAGMRVLWGDAVLRRLSIAWLVLVLGLGASMVADVALAEVFGAGSFGFGVFIASWGAGSIVGSLLGRFLNPRLEPPVLVAGTLVIAVTAILTGVAPWFWLACAAILLMGIGDGVTLVAEQSILQRRTPDVVRSRVSGAFDAVIHIGLAVSYVAAGPVVEALGAKGTYIAGGIVSFVAVVILLPVLSSRRPAGMVAARTPVDAPELVLGYSAGESDTTASTR